MTRFWGSGFVFLGAVAHILGGCLLLNGSTGLATWSAGLDAVFQSLLNSHGTLSLGVTLIVVGCLAIIGMFWKRWSDFLTAPQFLFFIAAIIGVTVAIANGTYPDGYIPKGGAKFIANDQVWLLAFASGHTAEFLLRLLRIGPWRRA